MSEPLRVLSLGAGVQSTTVLRMVLHGELPPLDAAIFADTREEPEPVYRHLDTLRGECEAAGIPLYVVSDPRSKGLTVDALEVASGERRKGIAQPPLHLRGENAMQIRRQCTTHLKIDPIKRKIRELAGLTRRRSPDHVVVEQVIGISWDEAQRMRDPWGPWVRNDYPLVDRRITRWGCKVWLDEHGYPEPPRSACVMCPYRNTDDWRQLKSDDPAGWDRAVEYDEMVRDNAKAIFGLEGRAFVHFSGRPLAEVDLSTPEDHGQQNLFAGQECEGMCGI